jgi:hypothetical protein
MANKNLYDSLEERFQINSIEWLETDMAILDMELKNIDVPEEMYEKRWVHWDNIDFLLTEVVRLGLIKEDSDDPS